MSTPPEQPFAASNPAGSNAATKEPWRSKWKRKPGWPPKEGGQTTVQVVESIDNEMTGALKLLRSDFDSERRARLAREVLLLQKLQGIPGIPAVLDHNTESFEDKDTALYVVLEFIEGRRLSEEFRNPLSIDQSTLLTIQLCEIIRACHSREIIHRDIKPDNILIDREAEKIWLIDFGTAWTEDESVPFKTEINEELGNRFLKLPELLSGIPKKHDVRSDLTFISGIFFWFLTNRKPSVLIPDDLKPPHRRLAESFPSHTVSDQRWSLAQSICDVCFAPALNQRFQNL